MNRNVAKVIYPTLLIMIALFAARIGGGVAGSAGPADRPDAVPAAASPPGPPIFAPGTSEAYMAEVLRAWALDHGRANFQSHWRSDATATGDGGSAQGDSLTLTWSIVPDGTSMPEYGGDPADTCSSNLIAHFDANYGRANWMAAVEQAFADWGSATGLAYVHEGSDDGAEWRTSPGQLGVRGDIRIGGCGIDGDSGILGRNYYPDSGDMKLDAPDSFYTHPDALYTTVYNVLAHEHGHGLGLSHVCPVNQTRLMEPIVTSAFVGIQHDDLRAGQRGYGDRFELVGNPNDGAVAATDLGTPTGAPLALPGLSVDGAGDEDWFRFDVSSGQQISLTLRPVGHTYDDSDQNSNGSCASGNPIDSAAIQDLGVQILGADGVTPVATVDRADAGEVETVLVDLGAAGTIYIRVYGDGLDGVQLYDLAFEVGSGWPVSEPRLALAPAALYAIQQPGNQVVRSLTLSNEGSAPLAWTVVEDSAARAPAGAVTLQLDGGNPTNAHSGTSVWQRFSPDPALYPFRLTAVQVYHGGSWANVAVGDRFDLYIYQDADGDGTIGDAQHLASLAGGTVAAVNTFATYPLPSALALSGPGDVIIGMVYRESKADSVFPSAFDSSVTVAGRAWYAYGSAATADPPDLAEAALVSRSNPWAIRGLGEKDVVCETPEAIPWLSLSSGGGSLPAGEASQVEVTLDASGLSAGSYEGTLCLESNDITQPEVRLPVTLEVAASCPAPALDAFAASPDGADLVLSWNSSGVDRYEVWWGADFYFLPGGDCGGAANCRIVDAPAVATTRPGALPQSLAYELRATNACGGPSTLWTDGGGSRPGTFSFALEPG